MRLVICCIGLISLGASYVSANEYSPNDVYSKVDYAKKLSMQLLESTSTGKLDKLAFPHSYERDIKPMHVYELQVAILSELYQYALIQGLRPPPVAFSTPIRYTPTDVYYLVELVVKNLERIYSQKVGSHSLTIVTVSNKSPSNVYQVSFELYYLMTQLNQRPQVSPNEVYSQLFRAKEDLQLTLLTLSKRLGASEQSQKRMLVTAIYGLHPDGSTLPVKSEGKRPADVLQAALNVRQLLNRLRLENEMAEIGIPALSDYSDIQPIDVYLQIQFVIAELNLLKIPLDIVSTTNSPKIFTGKTPSDVFYEMNHLSYMLQRLLQVRGL